MTSTSAKIVVRCEARDFVPGTFSQQLCDNIPATRDGMNTVVQDVGQPAAFLKAWCGEWSSAIAACCQPEWNGARPDLATQNDSRSPTNLRNYMIVWLL